MLCLDFCFPKGGKSQQKLSTKKWPAELIGHADLTVFLEIWSEIASSRHSVSQGAAQKTEGEKQK